MRRKKKSKQRYIVRVFLLGCEYPVVWIADNSTDIWQHIPEIGSEFGDTIVSHWDYHPIP